MNRKQVGHYSIEANTELGYLETDPTGRYGRFNEVLGKGAMKTVYKAIDELLGMEVAWNQVKLNEVLQKPEALERLYSEVHLLSTLNHDSIIHFYTSWIDVRRKTFNFITELFTSGTLREYMKKYRQVDIRAIKNWARQILQGLVYLHGYDPPVIHRDLKCDNIFVNGHLGQVKIGDLGLAAVLRDSKSAHSVIGTLLVICANIYQIHNLLIFAGTPEFMAPELYEEDYNELVDVYSFGMCLLEMLTSEYPYSECTNPAQIYKKVILGKLPMAFYRIQDFEAQKFIGKCLVAASKRLSAQELLLDPFLTSDEAELPILRRLRIQKPFLNKREMETLQVNDDPRRTDMTITGKLNPDDTIFLKVQIANKEGSSRNIYFPFDIIHDTPMDVAMEMVKELEIDAWEPREIAEMIDGEISALAPSQKKWYLPDIEAYQTFDYQKDDGHENPFPSSSSCSSSQASLSELMTHCLQDDLFEDTSSQSSSNSVSYSNLKYVSGDERTVNMSSTMRDKLPITGVPNVTRFCPQDNSSSHIGEVIARDANKNCNVLLDSQYRACSSKSRRVIDGQRLTRNQSLIDVRSQLLHQSLVKEVNKRRMFKTVGAVENIGFQAPPDVSNNASLQTWNGRN